MQLNPQLIQMLAGRLFRTPGINPNEPQPGMQGAMPQTTDPAQPQQPRWMQGLNSPLGQIGLRMLAGSRDPQGNPVGLGPAAGGAVLGYQQGEQDKVHQDLQRQYMQAQIKQMGLPNPTANTQPSSVREYEYAKQNGFNGSFQDWISAGGQSSRPSAITVFEYFDKLPPDKQKEMLETMRAPVVRDIGGVPTIVSGQGQTNPLSTLSAETEARATLAGAEAGAKSEATAAAERAAAIQKKGADATNTLSTLDMADSLIDLATGSAAGAARDKVAGWLGYAPDSAQAIASLKVLQANLMTSMPRMEGPQSDKDVQLYREAAGQIGDPAVPGPLKKAALKTIREINERYQKRAGRSEAPTGPAVGAVEGGYRFKGGDPADPNNWEQVR